MIADLHKVSGALTAGLIQLAPDLEKDLHGPGSGPAGNKPEALVSATRFAQLFDRLASRTGIENIGLRMGNAYRLGDTGAFGLGLIHAPTFGDALEFYCEFLPLVTENTMFEGTIGAKTVEFTWLSPPFVLERTNVVDFYIMLTLRHFRQYTGQPWSPKSVQLKRSKTIDPGAYRRAFSAHTEFGAPSNRIEISPTMLDQRNPSADARIHKQMKKLCALEADRRSKAETLGVKLDRALSMGLADGEFSLERSARAVGLSARSLQRRLASEGKTFEGLVNSARKEYSSHLLQYTDDSIDEIGHKLGYSGANAYSRAAAQWYGASPSKHRSTLRLN